MIDSNVDNTFANSETPEIAPETLARVTRRAAQLLGENPLLTPAQAMAAALETDTPATALPVGCGLEPRADAAPTVTIPRDFAALFGIKNGDTFAQIDETRAAYFRGPLPAQVIEPGTVCQLAATLRSGAVEIYIALMPEVAKWQEATSHAAKLGATLEVVAVAVAIIERAGGSAE